jgi:mono/diheme cytochrome c family protein
VRVAIAVVVAVILVIAQSARAEGVNSDSSFADAGTASAWRTLRAMDCARCHGKDFDGLAAPSIVDFARTQSRETFARKVLDGDPPRGMPAYRDIPSINEHIDDVYRYFLGRADGTIRAGSSGH